MDILTIYCLKFSKICSINFILKCRGSINRGVILLAISQLLINIFRLFSIASDIITKKLTSLIIETVEDPSDDVDVILKHKIKKEE